MATMKEFLEKALSETRIALPYGSCLFDTNEAEKKELPDHLKKIIKQVKEKERELAKYGFTVTDKTPKGYGPNELSEITSSLPLVYGGYHLNDNILDGITVDELQTMVVSNLSSDKVDMRSVMKEFETQLNSNVKDARFIAKKVIADMVKVLPDYMKR